MMSSLHAHRRLACALVTLAIVASSAGCATAKINEIRKNYVRDKASWELQCPRDRLTVEALGEEKMKAVESWSVEGCHKRAIYGLTADGPALRHSNM